MANSRGTIYTTPGVTQQRFESLLAKNYIGIGQIVGEELTNENIKDKKQTYKQQGTEVVLFRYKVRLCTKLDDRTPNDQCIFAFGQNNGPSGKGGFYFGNWRYPDGEFVEVYQHPVTGLYYIDNSVPVGVGVTLTQNRNGTQGCQPLSGYKPGSPTFQVSLFNQGPGGKPINETSAPHTGNSCKWDDLYLNMPTIELKTPCEPSSLAGVPSAVSGLLKDVQKLRTGLLGNDSFLVTSQEFVNEVQSKVDNVSSLISGAISWLIQEIKKQILRLVNTTVNNTVGTAYLNTRYQIFEGVDAGTKAINCAFEALLNLLAQFVRDALNNLINDILAAATCAIENFLSNLLSQIVNGILSAISGILSGISGIIGAAIDVIDTVLGVVESLLNLFEGCPPKQICPVDKEWNFLEGIAGDGQFIDISGIFSRVNSSISAFRNLGQAVTDFPSNFDNFNFNLDVNAALATAGGCFVGPSPCGPPVVRFFGGGAVRDAIGRAIVSSTGGVIGIDVIDRGFGYTSSPMVVISDPCGNGTGARAIAEIGPIIGTGTTEPPGGGERPRDIGPGIGTGPSAGIGTTGPGGSGIGTTGPGGSGIGTTGPGGSGIGTTGPGGSGIGTTGPGGSGIGTTGPGGSGIGTTGPSLGIGTDGRITPTIDCLFPSSSGYSVPGIYLDLTSTSSTINVFFDVSVISSSNQYSITIPGVGTIDQNSNDFTVTLAGGRIYGPCTASGGTLYLGNTLVPQISGSGTLPETCMVVGNSGRSWNSFFLRTSRGKFVDLINCNTSIVPSVGVTTVPIISSGFNYLPTPDGSRGANGLVYTNRCQTLVQRADGTWDQTYNPGDVITLETGDRISLPALDQIELGDSTLPLQLSRIGAFIVRVNPPLATVPYRSMVGFDDSPGTSPNASGWFSMEDYNEARRQGFSDADIRFYLEKNYIGRISPRVQSFLNDPNWGRLTTSPIGYYGIRQMFGFDDTGGLINGDYNAAFNPGTGFFGYVDYEEARRRGYSDADIRYYLENHYVGGLGERIRLLLEDPNFGRIQGINNMSGVVLTTPRDMRGFSDLYGGAGSFGNDDYEEARRQGYSDADIRFYLENHYTGTIGARVRTRLNDPSWGRIPRERSFSDVPGQVGAFDQADYEQARRQDESDQIFLASGRLYEQAVQQGYTDADIRYYLENYYAGEISPEMRARLDDPNWGRELPVISGPDRPAPPRIKSMLGFSDSYGRRDEFSTADLDEAKRQGFKDVDVRFYLENNYTGFISDSIKRLLSDPNWGRLGQTITVSVTAPGCPEEPVPENFISSSDNLISKLGDTIIADPGFGYRPNDKIVVIPSNGAELELELTNGSVSGVRVTNSGSGFTELPEIIINTDTGYNARIIPVLSFSRISDDAIGTETSLLGIGTTFVTDTGTPYIRVVDCVGTIPPRRQFDIVPE